MQMKKIKSLRSYISNDNLNESSLLAKGFAIGQRGRFFSNKSKLDSKVSALRTNVKSALTSNEPERQLKAILIAFSQLTEIVDAQSEMDTNLMQLVIALSLLHEGK